MNAGIGLQKLRNFAVQIRHSVSNEIKGTGFVISPDGKIVTCAHVILEAGVNPRDQNGENVGVYFPERRNRKSEYRRAKVLAYFPQHKDDVVLLQLIDGPSPLKAEDVCILGFAENSAGHDFMSFGYRRLDKYQGLPAYGKIIEYCDKPDDSNLQAELLMLTSQNIDSGMSGAPVLDVERNLVVGVISQTWDSGEKLADRDTSFAIDAYVLSLKPFKLALRSEDLPKGSVTYPMTDDIAEPQRTLLMERRYAWNNAPALLEEWVGRKGLLEALNEDWTKSKKRIMGLIGFGGEGKSSLARYWTDVLKDTSLQKPDGIFWWGFYDRTSSDEFFEAALKYMTNGKVDLSIYPTSSAKAHLIAAMLYTGRYLFILDGLEVVQHQDGDQYGQLKSHDLYKFLEYFSSPNHNSFCLITSRAPLMDLTECTTYQQYEVERLSPDEGRDLLMKLGVKGPDDRLDRVVADWDGHALTLTLIGSYLFDIYNGDIERIEDIPQPIAGESYYERIHKVLHRYDKHLGESERTFLKIFSAFRIPVTRITFDKFFRTELYKPGAVNASLITLDDESFESMIKRLTTYRILRYDARTGKYTSHPLIRAHYYAQLAEGDRIQAQDVHSLIKKYYLSNAKDIPHNPSLEDLEPLIESAYHACRCGEYDEASKLIWEQIIRRDDFWYTNGLAAYETGLTAMTEFFSNGDLSQDVMVKNPNDKSWILNAVGFLLIRLGRMDEARPLIERANYISLNVTKNYHWACIGYRNLAGHYVRLGKLDKSIEAAKQSLEIAILTKDICYERDSLASYAWAAHLSGDLAEANDAFQKAYSLEQKIKKLSFYSLPVTRYADHLRRIGNTRYARKIAEIDLMKSIENNWFSYISRAYRVLGDIDVEEGAYDSAGEYYNAALKQARTLSRRELLIETLLSRGLWSAKYCGDTQLNDLREALSYALLSDYRINEVDIRNALAWGYLAKDERPKAKMEASHAKQMSEKMGYYWGKKDSKEVLSEIYKQNGQ